MLFLPLRAEVESQKGAGGARNAAHHVSCFGGNNNNNNNNEQNKLFELRFCPASAQGYLCHTQAGFPSPRFDAHFLVLRQKRLQETAKFPPQIIIEIAKKKFFDSWKHIC